MTTRYSGLLASALLLSLTACAPTAPQEKTPTPPSPSGKSDIPLPPPPVAMDVSATLKESAKAQLVTSLAATDPGIRTHAVEGVKDALGTGGRQYLLAALSDPDPLVRFAACMACGEVRLEEARAKVSTLLSDQNDHVQIGAIFAMHRLGDTRYSSGLEAALRSPQADVRANSAFALGRLGEKSAVRVLRPLIRDRAVEVRLQAAEALWRLGNEDGLAFLVAAGVSGHPANQMVGLLGLAGPRDRRVIEHIRPGKESDYVEVTLVAARAMGMLGSDEGYTQAINATRSADARQRSLAALALGAIGRADAQESLSPMLKDEDEDVRLTAATAILELH